MKLSNQQIEVIVNLIAKQKEEKANALNAVKIKKEKQNHKARAQLLFKQYKTLPEDLKKFIKNYGKTEEEMVEFLMKNVEQVKINKQEIRDSIILASIDAESLAELKGKLKISF